MNITKVISYLELLFQHMALESRLFISFPWPVIDSFFYLFAFFNMLLNLCHYCFCFLPGTCVFLFSSRTHEYSARVPVINDSNFLLMSTFKTPPSLWIPSQAICCVTSEVSFMLWSKICSFVENPILTHAFPWEGS